MIFCVPTITIVIDLVLVVYHRDLLLGDPSQVYRLSVVAPTLSRFSRARTIIARSQFGLQYIFVCIAYYYGNRNIDKVVILSGKWTGGLYKT